MGYKKVCRECNEDLPITQFYKHSGMHDGHLNKCKDCVKTRVKIHRGRNIERIREYDRKRGNRQGYDYVKDYRGKFPNKYKAHTIVNNAIRDGKLFREACRVCGKKEKVHAHHNDYLKPLNIVWLCSAHHSQWHAMNGEALNA